MVASNHFILTKTQNLSPWLGGGFGMFASTDDGSARFVKATSIDVKGIETVIPLKKRYKHLKHKVRALPNSNHLNALAQSIITHLQKETDKKALPQISSLRIDVWKTQYAAGSLRPKQIHIAQESFTIDHKQ